MKRLFTATISKRFSSSSSSGKFKTRSSSSAIVPGLLIGSILLFGPGYNFLIKPTLKSNSSQKSISNDAPVFESSLVEKIPGVPYVEYLLIGGGTASISAMEAIKESQPNANVVILSQESDFPYQRPPLSKELWNHRSDDFSFTNWENKKTSVFYLPQLSYEKPRTIKELEKPSQKPKFMGNTSVVSLDAEKHTVTLNNGQVIQYGKVLIATGGNPVKPQFMSSSPESIKDKVMTFRTLADFKKLEAAIDSAKSVTIVGGGFLGSELAAALAAKRKDLKVTQVFPEEGNLSLVLPRYLTKWTTSKLVKYGVDVLPKAEVVRLEESSKKVKVLMKDESSITADIVVVAAGLCPNTELAKKSGLEIDPLLNGIVVNSELEARSDVFAAGDVSCYYDIALGRRRVEHYDHAVNSGRIAGLNMVGMKKPYIHQSMFWSSIGPEISFEAIGILDSKMQTVSVWSKQSPDAAEGHDRGVVYYLRDRKVCGVLLWNVFGQLENARKIVDSKLHIANPDSLSKSISVN